MPNSEPKQPQQKLTVAEVIAKLHEIQQGLGTLRDDLHSNIEALGEDPEFHDRMLDLQRDADQRASSLEREVKRLRSDVKAIKDLLGEDAEEKSADSS
jgi:uncharacterized phage infection (PIP) family protein YhgE